MMNTSSRPAVNFHFIEPVTLTQRTLVKEIITYLFKKEKTSLKQLQYIFCSDEYLLDINRQHLNHDYYTDIITFDLSEKGEGVTGEIYISVDRIKDNAREFGVPVKHELIRVILHGALHLCGYKDKSKKHKELMTKMEDKYLKYFLSKVK
jgi:probable rRNA maturation factor